jgi:hypothetical protein
MSLLIRQRSLGQHCPPWERTSHWVCSSCKRQSEHIRTSLGTWIFINEYPSDRLRTFRKLNCRASFGKNKKHRPCYTFHRRESRLLLLVPQSVSLRPMQLFITLAVTISNRISKFETNFYENWKRVDSLLSEIERGVSKIVLPLILDLCNESPCSLN